MNEYGTVEKIWHRTQNLVRRITIRASDDTGVFQKHQTEGYPGEIRDDIIRVQEVGFSSMPLPGAEGVVVNTNAGYHGNSTMTGTNDPRYRPKNQKPGEITIYEIDGADAKGENGTLRTILKGALGWITSLFGKTIEIGTAADTLTITVKGKDMTITGTGNVTITGVSGDCTINGVSLVSHTHPDPQGGNTGPPNH